MKGDLMTQGQLTSFTMLCKVDGLNAKITIKAIDLPSAIDKAAKSGYVFIELKGTSDNDA